jgi:hypothetical protein
MSKEEQDEQEFTKSCTEKPGRNSGLYFGSVLVLTQKSTAIAATLIVLSLTAAQENY